MNKYCKRTIIGVIAVTLLLFLIGGFTEFAETAVQSSAPVTNEPVKYEEMLFVQLGAVALLPLLGSLSAPLAVFLSAFLAVFFLLKDKTHRLSVLFSVIMLLYLFMSLMLMTASKGWFYVSETVSYVPAAGFWLLLLSTLLSFFAVAIFAADYAMSVYKTNHAAETQISEILKWKTLLDEKAIDEKEFDVKKTQILNGEMLAAQSSKQQKNLSDLKQLLSVGALTQEEYEAKKKEIL